MSNTIHIIIQREHLKSIKNIFDHYYVFSSFEERRLKLGLYRYHLNILVFVLLYLYRNLFGTYSSTLNGRFKHIAKR